MFKELKPFTVYRVNLSAILSILIWNETYIIITYNSYMVVPFVPCLFSTAWKLLQSQDQVRGNRSHTQVPDDTNTIKEIIKKNVRIKLIDFSQVSVWMGLRME